MHTAQLGLKNPIAIRYPRGKGVLIDWKQPFSKIEIGKGVCLQKGENIAILSIGSIAKNVSNAIRNTTISHYDIRFLKPLDENILHTIFSTYSKIITVEDGTIKGGLGSSVLEFASKYNYKNTVSILGIPDDFIHQGTVDELHKISKIDAESISQKIKELQ
jgi:1-deoxy-D-xylulose-5-phosphate synthase